MQDAAATEAIRKRMSRNEKRLHELDMLIRKIYEDHVAGRLPERLFQDMLRDYESEQVELSKIIDIDQADLQRNVGGQHNIDRFLALVRKYQTITELTPAIINEFVDKVLVHEAVGKGADRSVRVDIYLNYIGQFQVPEEPVILTEEERIAAEKKANKLRRKRESNRKYMRKVYAQRKAERIAELDKAASESALSSS